MYHKIVLAGGSGYIGQVLASYYQNKAATIVVLTRQPQTGQGNITFQLWDGKTLGPWTTCLEGADLLINLCGKNVNCRYTAANRRAILTSRTEPTELLANAINTLKDPPRMWLNLTSATIYRHAEDAPQTENHGDIGYGFSVEVCQAWEKSFWALDTPQTKKVVLRTGIVMGRTDGVMPRLKKLVQCGLGGHQGHGYQYVSWIHEQDLARITEWVYQNAADGAIYNGTAPEAISNKALMGLIRKTLGIPIGLPTPQWLLEIGAVLIGTETELVLKSRWVYPENLLASGFQFHFPAAGPAVHDLLSCRV